MYVLKKLPLAEADIVEAAEWYEAHRPGLGDRFVSAVQLVDRLLVENPLRYAIRFENIRRLNLRDFPYSIFFCLQGEMIVVLAVLHFRRDTRPILERRRRLL